MCATKFNKKLLVHKSAHILQNSSSDSQFSLKDTSFERLQHFSLDVFGFKKD